MQLTEAIHLIRGAVLPQERSAAWADLGCGSGLFTQALTSLLPEGSTVCAVDKNRQSITPVTNKVTIEFLQADFAQDEFMLHPLDGILMANSLHYVADKKSLLARLKKSFGGEGAFIIVEYDTLHANRWVPYPINFTGIRQLFGELGFAQVTKLGERPSLYRQGNLYAAFGRVQP